MKLLCITALALLALALTVSSEQEDVWAEDVQDAPVDVPIPDELAQKGQNIIPKDRSDGIHDGKVSLDYHPLKNRCSMFQKGDELYTWEQAGKDPSKSTDLRCADQEYIKQMVKTNGVSWKCAGGYPFYRIKSTLMDPDMCFLFCLSKGMDAFAFVHDSAAKETKEHHFETEAECRCGASAHNTDVWEGVTAPSYLLPPAHGDKGQVSVDKAIEGQCDIESFHYSGKMAEKGTSVPEDIMFATMDDESYIDSIVAGCTVEHHEEDAPKGGSGTSRACKIGTPRPGFQHTKQLIQTVNDDASQWAQANYRKCWPDSCGPAKPWPSRVASSGAFKERVQLNYYFDTAKINDARKQVVYAAAEALKKATCLNIVEKTASEVENTATGGLKITVVDENSCYVQGLGFYAYSSDRARVTTVNLGWCNNMRYVGNIIHELMHALGSNHEQKRPDAQAEYEGKGPHLLMKWDNISPAWKGQWLPDKKSYTGSGNDGAGDPKSGYSKYDFGSIMHYPKGNSATTLPPGMPTGQRSKLAESDIEQIIDMYQCKPQGSGGGSMPKAPTKAPTKSPIKSSSSGCTADVREECSAWVSKGFCSSYAQFMNINCCKSCESSGGSTGTCGGDNTKATRCKTWGTKYCKGYSINGVPVSTYCAAPCGSC